MVLFLLNNVKNVFATSIQPPMISKRISEKGKEKQGQELRSKYVGQLSQFSVPGYWIVFLSWTLSAHTTSNITCLCQRRSKSVGRQEKRRAPEMHCFYSTLGQSQGGNKFMPEKFLPWKMFGLGELVPFTQFFSDWCHLLSGLCLLLGCLHKEQRRHLGLHPVGWMQVWSDLWNSL